MYGELPDNDPLLAIRKVLSGQPELAAGLNPAEADLIRDCLAPVGQRPATAQAVAARIRSLG
jgi:hypothetical protein